LSETVAGLDIARNDVVGLDIVDVTHRYANLVALKALSLQVPAGSIFGILGPNGSGKSTLFRLISTLVAVQEGSIRVNGFCVTKQTRQVRERLGVVFQSPSLDRKLTVVENMVCQAALHGIRGSEQTARIDELILTMALDDKRHVRCEKLSGGQKRRAELAKGLLHRPRVLLLDEPSTGLDPASRLDLWHALTQLRSDVGTTILLTTHLLEEADKCDRVAILNAGSLVACDSPDRLRSEAGDLVVTIATSDPSSVAAHLKQHLHMDSTTFEQQVRVAAVDALHQLPAIIEQTKTIATSVSVGRPSLEDVFIAKTGHAFHVS
jgi:ABC-2 type transport system ATP-binding protein